MWLSSAFLDCIFISPTPEETHPQQHTHGSLFSVQIPSDGAVSALFDTTWKQTDRGHFYAQMTLYCIQLIYCAITFIYCTQSAFTLVLTVTQYHNNSLFIKHRVILCMSQSWIRSYMNTMSWHIPYIYKLHRGQSMTTSIWTVWYVLLYLSATLSSDTCISRIDSTSCCWS